LQKNRDDEEENSLNPYTNQCRDRIAFLLETVEIEKSKKLIVEL